MALALAILFGAGATTGAITLVLPHSVGFNDSALWSNVAIAYFGALVLAITAGRLPRAAIHAAVVLGTVVVTRAVYYGDDPTGFYSLWYLWVGLYAFFFFGRLGGLAHLAIVAAAYAWVLTQVAARLPLAQWVMTIGTLAIAGLMIDILAERVRRRAEQADSRAAALVAVSEVAHELARRDSPSDAAATICSAAVDVAGALNAALLVPGSDGRGLVAIAATLPALRGIEVPFLGVPSGSVKAFTSGERFFVGDAPGHPEINQQLLARYEAAALLFEPVLREGTPIGVLTLYWDRTLSELGDDLGRLIELLATEASVAIERTETLERLERVARTDDLTGLANRRAWHEQLSREIARARRQGTPLAVGILDLDHFKAYNDRHGHLVGDQFLKRVAAEWSELVRDTDILARYGGEEFALAFPDTELTEAEALLERLREATPEGECTSAGVALWDGAEDEAKLIARADKALYSAKRGGRDRVIVA
jgi:diguanylate cyclase (GGDEF)-like protein